MLPEKIMQSDLLDILFENRNKLYGAYTLRKSYNKTMALAITITFFVAVAFSVFQFIHHTKNGDLTTQVIIPPDAILTSVNDKKILPPVQPQQHVAASHVNQVINSVPKIVSDNDKTDMPTVDDITKNIIGFEKITGSDNVDIIQPPATTHENTGTITTVIAETKVDETPLHTAQVMPEYPGGIEALKKFMLKNLRQPEDLQAGEKIIVMASFIVNKNGQIETVKIINDGRTDLNKEVMRVINKMPLWKPGMQNGNAVSVYFNLPVTFMSEDAE